MTPGERFLIVNADDFGQSPGINRGIIHAHERGIVTSASLMVRWPAAAEASVYSRTHTDLSVGLHLDLEEWRYETDEWRPLYEVVPVDDERAVHDEVERQLEGFRRLVGRDPTHLDSHQHVHLEEPALTIACELAGRLGIPLRGRSGRVRYRGDFYGQGRQGEALPAAITVEALVGIFDRLEPGWTELGCHPGLEPDLTSMYVGERAIETAALCDARLGSVLRERQIELRSFKDVPAALQ